MLMSLPSWMPLSTRTWQGKVWIQGSGWAGGDSDCICTTDKVTHGDTCACHNHISQIWRETFQLNCSLTVWRQQLRGRGGQQHRNLLNSGPKAESHPDSKWTWRTSQCHRCLCHPGAAEPRQPNTATRSQHTNMAAGSSEQHVMRWATA